VLSEKNGQLDSSVANLARTTAVLDSRRTDMRETLDDMPETLESTEKMLSKLRKTLNTLEDTSDDIRPSVQELEQLLGDLDPVLVEANPVIRDLRIVARDLRPVVDDLTPIADDLTGVYDNLRGPVLSRINSQILPTLDSGWSGSGLYVGNGSEDELYKVIGYTLSNLTQGNMADANGAMGNVQNGHGPGSLMGLPLSGDLISQMLAQLAEGAP
jgi:phospholipid/cholesterol/gamma-HCH transport system substrate-binding protein